MLLELESETTFQIHPNESIEHFVHRCLGAVDGGGTIALQQEVLNARISDGTKKFFLDLEVRFLTGDDTVGRVGSQICLVDERAEKRALKQIIDDIKNKFASLCHLVIEQEGISARTKERETIIQKLQSKQAGSLNDSFLFFKTSEIRPQLGNVVGVFKHNQESGKLEFQKSEKEELPNFLRLFPRKHR